MVTAYDAPSGTARGRRRRRRDPRGRLGRDDRARPRLDRPGDDGRDDRAHAGGHARRAAAARRRRTCRSARSRSPTRRRCDNAIRFVKEAGADAVKLEGAGPTLSRVRAIVGAGIPVMGHIGLTPQSATMLGGFKAQGRTAEKAVRLYEDALALEAAGCFAIVLEAVPAPVAARITDALTMPTIGIGAGAGLRRAGARLARPARALRGPRAALRQAVRGPLDGDQDGRRHLRGGGSRTPLPGGAAHVRDARRTSSSSSRKP